MWGRGLPPRGKGWVAHTLGQAGSQPGLWARPSRELLKGCREGSAAVLGVGHVSSEGRAAGRSAPKRAGTLPSV